MKSAQTPALAEWLLKQFGCSPNNTAIIGDLNERYRQGHSRLWYWRQVFVTILIGLWQEIRSDATWAGRALTVAWSLELVAAATFVLLFQVLRGQPGRVGLLPASWTAVRWIYVRGWIFPSGDAVVMALISCLLAFSVVWLLGRVHRPHHAKAVLIYAEHIGGWTVERSSQDVTASNQYRLTDNANGH